MFSEGAFREAYKAYAVAREQTLWLVKKFKNEAWERIAEIME